MKSIPSVNVLSGKADRTLGASDQLQKTNHRRQFQSEADGADLPVVLFNHLHFAEAKKRDSPFPVDDLEGLIGDIQEQHTFHKPILEAVTLADFITIAINKTKKRGIQLKNGAVPPYPCWGAP